MIIALTGTPGTGKSAVAALLSDEHGYRVVDVNETARESGCVLGHDSERDSDIVDIDALRDILVDISDADGDVVLEGHLSHHLKVDMVVILRCRPTELVNRLEEKGFSPKKTRENLEAEVVDVVLVESVDAHGTNVVFEIDTTFKTPHQTAVEVKELVEDESGSRQSHRPGKVNWLAEGWDWL